MVFYFLEANLFHLVDIYIRLIAGEYFVCLSVHTIKIDLFSVNKCSTLMVLRFDIHFAFNDTVDTDLIIFPK